MGKTTKITRTVKTVRVVKTTKVVREEKTPAASAVERTENAKLGPVSATYASQASCPRSCPWFGAGCYAESGPVSFTTRRLNRGEARKPADVAREEAEAIDRLSGWSLLRLHVVGDCRTNAAARIVGEAARRYSKRGALPRTGRKVWTYTHSWRTVDRSAWGDAVSVLASVETPQDARKAIGAGYAAALVVSAFEREGAYPIGEGLTLVPCPEQTRGVNCERCGLCRDEERLRSSGIVIGFRAHGSGGSAVRRHLIGLPMA